MLTGPQLQEMGLWIAPLPCAWPVTDDMVNPPHFPTAIDEVHHVGEIVAIVLADSRYGAADAAEMVAVDYEPLDAVASVAAARDGDVGPIGFRRRGHARQHVLETLDPAE